MKTIKNKIAVLLDEIGFTANTLTFLGLFTAFLSGLLIYQGKLLFAGVVLILSGILDLLDGEVARVSGEAGGFGGILDSSLDRYGDGFVFTGIVFFCIRQRCQDFHLCSLSPLSKKCLNEFFQWTY